MLTGDIHTNWVNDLKVNFATRAPVVATSSSARRSASGGDGLDQAARMKDVLAENPFVKFQNQQRGYVSCSVTPQAWHADYQVVDFVTKPDAPRRPGVVPSPTAVSAPNASRTPPSRCTGWT